MANITHTILMHHSGECSTTPHDPSRVVAEVRGNIAVLDDGSEVDLTETKDCIHSHDDWRGVITNRYGLCTVELPEWLTPQEWCRRSIDYKYAMARGMDLAWGEKWCRTFMTWRPTVQLAAAKLLNQNRARMRSSFRISLYEQIVAFMEDPDGSPYDSPLSPRQVGCLIQPWEADLVDKGAYNNRRWWGIPLTGVDWKKSA